MKKTSWFTKTLALFLTVLMLLSVAPLSEFAGLDLGFKLKADAVSGYSAGGAAEWAKQHYKDHDSVLLGTGYWDDGGDCANFVSQCLYMGGIDMDGYWNTTGYLAHWSEPYGYDYAGSFIRCVQLYNYLVYQKGGQVIHNPSASQVDIGDVLIYYRAEAGRFGHSAIVADIEGGVPKIAYHSVGWDHDFKTNWHLGFTGDQTYLIKLHGSVCVNQRTRSVDVYRYAWGSAKLFWEPNGGYTNHFFIENDYALVDEIRWINGQAWGHTMLDAIWGWTPLQNFTFMGHYDTPSVSHKFGDWQTVQVANCQQDGIDRHVCTRCGYTETRTTKGGHITDPHATCTTEGLCKICGAVTENALGHIWDEGRVSKQPTCTEPGDMLYYCERDHSHQYTDEGVIPALGHDYLAVPTSPTCVSGGDTETYKCSRCLNLEVRYVDPGNTWSGWTTEELDLPADKVRSTTQYRYRDKSFFDSSKDSLDDWILYDTTWEWSPWSAWSNYSTTPITPTDEIEVETRDITRTQYNYSKYYGYSGKEYNGPVQGTWSGVYCGNYAERGWSDSSLPIYKRDYSNQYKAVYGGDGYFNMYNYSTDTWYNEWTRQVYDHTEYRYHTRYKIYTYHYYQWQNWSAWSETEPETLDDREIESRTVYSYDLAALGHDFSVPMGKAFVNRDLLLTDEQVNDICYVYANTCARCGAYPPDSEEVPHDIPDFESERDQYEIVSGDDASVTVYKGVCRNGCGCYVLKTVDNHNYVLKEVVPPTCNGENGTEGYTVYRCTYHGEEYNDDFVPALEDDYSHDVWEVQTSPTCTEPGVEICKCARFDACGHYITREIAPLGHSMTAFEAQAATCLLDGNSEYYYCAGCDKYFADEEGTTEIEEDSWVIPATGHSNIEDVEWSVETERKCGSAGLERKYCANEWCDLKQECDICSGHGIHGAVLDERETEPIPAVYYVFKAEYAEYDPTIESDFEIDKWVPTTCDHFGKLYITCKNCEGTEDAHGYPPDKPYSIELIDPLPHLPVERIDPEPLCIYPGVKHTDCERCGKQDIVEPEEIPAPYAEHDMEERQDEGCIYHVCTRCGYSPDTDAHDYQRDPDRDIAPTCLKEGKEAYTCSRCGKQDDTTLDPLGHDPVKAGSLPATCTEGGVDQFACRREGCNFTYDVPTSQPLGHDDSGSYTVTKKGTCTEEGKKELCCVRENARTDKVCGAVLSTLIISARGHNMSDWLDDAASGEDACRRKDCLNTETKEYEACTFNVTEGHNWGSWSASGDNHIRTCLNIADHTQTQAHVWTKLSEADADCTNSGSISWRCDVCGATKTETVDPKGHIPGDPTVEKATCLDDGAVLIKCTRCGATLSEEIIPARGEVDAETGVKGHVWSDWMVVKPLSEHEEGLERRVCLNQNETEHYAPCSAYETRPIIGHTVTFMAKDANGEYQVIDQVYYAEGATSVSEPKLISYDDRLIAYWPDYHEEFAKNEDFTVKAAYESKSAIEPSDLESEKTVQYVKSDATVTLTAFAETLNARAKLGAKPVDIVLVLDHSKSMVDNKMSDNKTTRYKALQNAAGAFVEKVSENAEYNGVDHRIAIVAYNSDAYAFRNGTWKTITNTIKPSFVSVLNAKDSILEMVNAPRQNSSGTCTDRGMAAAADLLDANSNRKQIVVLFTDGEPTSYSIDRQSGFSLAVANNAIQSAKEIKDLHVPIYCIGVTKDAAPGAIVNTHPTSTKDKLNTFLHAVSSNYPDASELYAIGERAENSVDYSYYVAASSTDELTGLFNSIVSEQVLNTITFQNITIVDTVSKYFTLTQQQESELRKFLSENYGVTNDRITVTRNDDGTTTIQIENISPVRIEKDGKEGYGITVSYEVTANENAVGAGTYSAVAAPGGEIDENTYIMKDGEIYSKYTLEEIGSFTVNEPRFIVRYVVEGETIDIVDIENTMLNQEVDVPNYASMTLAEDNDFVVSGYDTVIHYTYLTDQHTVKWYYLGEEETHTYYNGEIIRAPKFDVPEGFLFTGWDAEVPFRMGDCDLTFTAKLIEHSHDYFKTVSGSCPTGVTNTYTCVCGRSFSEQLNPCEHTFTANVAYREGAAYASVTCSVCSEIYQEETEVKYQAAYAARADAELFDLTLVEGSTPVQPDGTIIVQVALDDDELQNANKLYAYRIEKTGKTAVRVEKRGGFALLYLDHFSYYMITTQPENSANIPAFQSIVCLFNGHTLTHVDAKAATTEAEGNVEYYHCSVCGKNFSDAAGKTELTKVTTDKLQKQEEQTTEKTDDSDNSKPAGACPYCGQVHTGLFGWLIKLIHLILALFGLRK